MFIFQVELAKLPEEKRQQIPAVADAIIKHVLSISPLAEKFKGMPTLKEHFKGEARDIAIKHIETEIRKDPKKTLESFTSVYLPEVVKAINNYYIKWEANRRALREALKDHQLDLIPLVALGPHKERQFYGVAAAIDYVRENFTPEYMAENYYRGRAKVPMDADIAADIVNKVIAEINKSDPQKIWNQSELDGKISSWASTIRGYTKKTTRS